jgi:hypothetical protein
VDGAGRATNVKRNGHWTRLYRGRRGCASLHQPLHSSDDADRGGNNKRVSAAGFKAGNLHHFWDTEFVDQLGPDTKSIASDLIGHISKDQQKEWEAGELSDWAEESFQIAKDDAYGELPAPWFWNIRAR